MARAGSRFLRYAGDRAARGTREVAEDTAQHAVRQPERSASSLGKGIGIAGVGLGGGYAGHQGLQTLETRQASQEMSDQRAWAEDIAQDESIPEETRQNALEEALGSAFGNPAQNDGGGGGDSPLDKVIPESMFGKVIMLVVVFYLVRALARRMNE